MTRTIRVEHAAPEFGTILTVTGTTATVELDRWPDRRFGPYPLHRPAVLEADGHTHTLADPTGRRCVVWLNHHLSNPFLEALIVAFPEV